jgi:hypothetical protein
VIPTLEQPPVLRLTSISRVLPDLQRQERPTPPASCWRHIATLLPPLLVLFRRDVGVRPEGDYSNKYYIKSGETQFTGEKLENSVEPADMTDGESWRCTEVQTYRSTVVQEYSCTDTCCYREDGGSLVLEKGTQA